VNKKCNNLGGTKCLKAEKGLARDGKEMADNSLNLTSFRPTLLSVTSLIF